MAIIYSDAKIEELLQECKPLSSDWRLALFETGMVCVEGVNGNEFCIRVRQNKVVPLDFSLILTVRVPLSNQEFRLRRYNGSTSPHNNPIENEEIVGFHIHCATERYQQEGYDEETFAEQTTQYCDLNGALRCLLNDANFREPVESQLNLVMEV